MTDEEVELLEHRNDFLHGRSPGDDDFEVERIALEFHQLIGSLVLKLVGYEGYMTNLAVAHLLTDEVKAAKHIRNFDPEKITSPEIIKERLESGDVEGLQELIENTMNAYKAIAKLSSFIKMI